MAYAICDLRLAKLSSVGDTTNEGLELARNWAASNSCALIHEVHLGAKRWGHHLVLG